MNKLFIVAQREYLKVVRKPWFWLGTVVFPLFLLLVMFISGYAAEAADTLYDQSAEDADRILIVDDSGIIAKDFLQEPFEVMDSREDAIATVQENEADAAFYYPADILTSQQIQVHRVHKDLISNGNFDSSARGLLQLALVQSLENPETYAAIQAPYNVEVTPYQDGEEVDTNIANLIVPGVSVIVYFLIMILSVNVLLSSISEEKENRMMETMWTMVPAKYMMGGKVIGLGGVVLTQVVVLGGFLLAGFFLTGSQIDLPVEIDFSTLEIQPIQILLGVVYVVLGAAFLANIMIGVGAAVPTFKEAQQLSTPFMLLSVFPIYFIALIITDPEGLLAIVTSYTPFTAPFVLLVRNALGALAVWEVLLGTVVLCIYLVLSIALAARLFSLGALEYTNRISIKRLFKK